MFLNAGRRLNKVEIAILKGSWENLTYEQIASTASYSVPYVKRHVGPQLWKLLAEALGERVSKSNFRSALERRWRTYRKVECAGITLENSIQNSKSRSPLSPFSNKRLKKSTFWGEPIDVSMFYGRTAELNRLKQWLIKDRCRLVALLGMGGIGKTSLAAKLAQQVHGEFDYFIWRSLYNPPPLFELLANLIEVLSAEQVIDFDIPDTIDGRIYQLIDYLRSSRCLIILDNAETILQSGTIVGSYREGYEECAQLLRLVGEVAHTSTVVLTSREKPKEVALLEGKALPVRSLHLNGLKVVDGQKIFESKELRPSESELISIVERYAGNALALKIVSTTILDVFHGNTSEFLKQNVAVLGDIRQVLTQQFSRLSNLEKEIMCWLAINREPVSISELQDDILLPILPQQLLEALESLIRRSLVEKSSALFTLQPVVMEYITHQLVQKAWLEITNHNLVVFKKYALIKAIAKDYIKDIQIRFILKPIIDGLLKSFGSCKNLENQLSQVLATLQEKFPQQPSYAPGNILNILCYLKTDLSKYDFSNLTIWQADLRNVNLHNVSFAHANVAKSVFTETFRGILTLAFSPNQQFLAEGDINAEIRLYQLSDWIQLNIFKGHTDWVTSIAFSPDSSILASGSEDQTIKLWDVITSECLDTLQGHEKGIWSLAFSSNGQMLVSASDDKTIKIWDVNTRQCLKTFSGHENMVRGVVFSADNTMLASASVDKTLKLWDVSTEQCLRTLQGHDEAIWSAAISPDGRTLASASGDQTVKLWDVDTGECLRTLQGHFGWVISVAFSPDGQALATGSWDQTVKLWNVTNGECLKTLPGHSNMVRAVEFSPQGNILASGSDDQSLRLWDVNTGQCIKNIQGYTTRIWSVVSSPEGNILASSSNKNVKLWDINTGQNLQTFVGHSHEITSLVFSPDGQTLASASKDKTVKIWDVKTGKCLRTLQGHTKCVWSVAFSPDGLTLASGSHDYTLRLWDVSNGKCLRTLHEENHGVLSVAFSPDGLSLASSGDDHTVKLWHVSNGKCLRTLEGHTGWVWAIAFSPDGQILSSGSGDYTVKLWDVFNGKCLRTLEGHTGWVCAIAFSCDGQILSSGSMDQTVKLWDVSVGKCLKTLQGHSQTVLSVTFNPSGETLISSSEDETLRIWDVSTGEHIKMLRSKRLYEGMNITKVTGLTEATITTLKTLGAIESELNMSQLNQPFLPR
ncbi:MAG: hypothetical protein KME33_23660 [Aetokthonos hydrillicola CCALA 1050]|nr:hypothetical protein [Aetokthonos hydrillicola CCALA 1050]